MKLKDIGRPIKHYKGAFGVATGFSIPFIALSYLSFWLGRKLEWHNDIVIFCILMSVIISAIPAYILFKRFHKWLKEHPYEGSHSHTHKKTHKHSENNKK